MTYPKIGYWFSAFDTLPNDDGRKVILGESLSVKGKLALCKNGLHYSAHPFDALIYAKGFNLYKVEAIGKIIADNDKACTDIRKHLAVVDAKKTILLFARLQAKSVIHLWDAPEVVKDFLETGNTARAARAAAEAAAWAAARAARAAAEAAAEAAARAAAWAAARAAAWAAAEAAAWAARAAAEAAARAAARDQFKGLVDKLFKEEIRK